MASSHASKHNEAMTYVFSNLAAVPTANIESVVAGIYGDFCTGNGLPWPFGPIYPPTFPTEFNEINLRDQVDQSGKSAALKAAANGILDIVDLRLAYHDFDQELLNLEGSIAPTLDGDDAATFADMVSVARQSHELYFSATGEATDFQVLAAGVPGGGIPVEDVVYAVDWWKVLAVDIIGGMMGGPGGYLGASAIAVIMQL